VRIEARLISATDVWLWTENCPSPVHSRGLEFDNQLAVKFPGDLLIGCKISFPLHRPSDLRLQEALRTYNRKTQQIYVVLEGIIETRQSIEDLTFGDPPSHGGFGHMGAAPAQIIVDRILDLQIRPKKK
jgi:hypothetical protein